MKIDFDKFNLSQKIYSILGAVVAILIYMLDGDQLNVSIGALLLTAIVVFLSKYNNFKKFFNVAVILLLSFIFAYFGFENYQERKEINEQEILKKDSNYYAVLEFSSNEFTTYEIIKVINENYCLNIIKNRSGHTSAKCLDGLSEYAKYFNERPTGDWYFVWAANQNGLIISTAKVIKYPLLGNYFVNQNSKLEIIRNQGIKEIESLQENSTNLTLKVFSPNKIEYSYP